MSTLFSGCPENLGQLRHTPQEEVSGLPNENDTAKESRLYAARPGWGAGSFRFWRSRWPAAAATTRRLRLQTARTQAPSAQLTGDVAIAGSSTVFPISEAVAEEFSIANKNVRVNVASTGTGAGGRAMCAGEIQVWDASRPAKDSELQACADNGIEVIELPVAFDALSVVVSPENDWAQCLTVDELKTIFGPEAHGNITNWNQVRSGFPDQGLRIYGPTPSSGTFDYFTEAIMGESGAHRGDLDLATEEDPLIASGVNGARGGIGYFGLAYLEQYHELVEPVEVVNPGTGECVAPSTASVSNGQYIPLARPDIHLRAAGPDAGAARSAGVRGLLP